ncbi:hypothetical protein ACFQX7_33995 [Luedemannella flava]
MLASFVVRAAHAFDGERFLSGGAQVHVEGDRIIAVRPRDAPLAEGQTVVDHPDATVLPGLIDTHVHLVAGDEPDAPRWTPDGLPPNGNTWSVGPFWRSAVPV